MTSRLMEIELGRTYRVELNYRAAQGSVNTQMQRIRAMGGVLDPDERIYVVTPADADAQCHLNWLLRKHGVSVVG